MVVAPFGLSVPEDVQELGLNLAEDLGYGVLVPFTGYIIDQPGNDFSGHPVAMRDALPWKEAFGWLKPVALVKKHGTC